MTEQEVQQAEAEGAEVIEVEEVVEEAAEEETKKDD